MSTWIEVCHIDDLQADSGVCALVKGKQVAIFYLPRRDAVYAIGNFDPFSGANVLSRGMIGDIGGEPMVASPMYKQHFHLRTGVCFEDANVSVPAYPVRLENGRVAVLPAPLSSQQKSPSLAVCEME
ncbi:MULTISPECIES: nitrite reductase small subunit NirD [Methylomonas]|uniref:Nitrite reductase small subunit n=2 Tax=Methylomonas TaxID=416 RepID=A0A140E709_9GAMM|nr:MULTISPECIES: nitrite reductase small subunit NirD [Methylomonas]AMK79183.1 nitrite reductase small subunit [Methylomonas denitrificans]OAH98183.1 nitrite reductase small subunit [Methylomonas methanica]TCV86299.1 assimilatory nitrite reductase (NAD(P)H) small subunit [Methylomonas methanica]